MAPGGSYFYALMKLFAKWTKNWPKGGSDLILVLFGIKMARKYVPGGHNIHALESTSYMPVTKVAWSHSKKFLRKWPNTSKNPILTHFLWSKINWENWSKEQKIKILIAQIFGQHCYVHWSQLSERLDKNGGHLIDLKKVQRTDARRTDGSAFDKLRCWHGQRSLSNAEPSVRRASVRPLNLFQQIVSGPYQMPSRPSAVRPSVPRTFFKNVKWKIFSKDFGQELINRLWNGFVLLTCPWIHTE